MKRFLIALQFLTTLPVKITPQIKNEDFARSLLYFPLIGLLIGLFLAGVAYLSGFLPNLVKSIIILIVSIVITGGIHIEGLADTCDGLFSGKSKEKILEIMREPHIGVMGVIGIICLLLLKLCLIASIPQNILAKSLIIMTTFSRWSQSLACYVSEYARKEGKAKYFMEYKNRREFLVGSIFTLAIFILLFHLRGLFLFILSLPPVSLFITYIKKKIGGMTGDTIGAVSEFSEVLVLLLCCPVN